jgi:putative transposase
MEASRASEPEYRTTTNCVYAIEVEVAWVTEGKRGTLTNTVKAFLGNVLKDAGKDSKIIIRDGKINRDSVHLRISIPPSMSVAEAVRILKGRSTRLLLDGFKDIFSNTGGRVWTTGYFASTIGAGKADGDKYIREHSGIAVTPGGES